MVTNDGATILKSIALDNAAAKVLVCSIARSQNSLSANNPRSTSQKSRMTRLGTEPPLFVFLQQNYFAKQKSLSTRRSTHRPSSKDTDLPAKLPRKL